jgi:hypothetical protein
MRSFTFVAVFLASSVLLLGPGVGIGADDPDFTLPENGGFEPGELAPWTGLVDGGGGPRVLIDDFNRVNGPLGSDWTVQAASFEIFNQAARGGTIALATHNSATGDTVDMDVAHSGVATTQYAAAILNYGGGSTNLFVKVQDNGSTGQFNRLYCYIGNNNGGGAFAPSAALTTTFSTAHMTVTVDASRTVSIDFTNVNGGALADQHYECAGAPAAEGPAIGMAAYTSQVLIDNFGNTPVPVELLSLSVE